jgi:hypothetical protein
MDAEARENTWPWRIGKSLPSGPSDGNPRHRADSTDSLGNWRPPVLDNGFPVLNETPTWLVCGECGAQWLYLGPGIALRHKDGCDGLAHIDGSEDAFEDSRDHYLDGFGDAEDG